MVETPKIHIDDKYIVSFLVCFLLLNCGKLSEQNLVEIATDDDMVGYFDLISGIDVAEKKHMVEKGADGLYSITEDGKKMAAEFQNKIPLSIREKTLESGKKIGYEVGLRQSFDWEIEKLEKGFRFHIRFKNEMGGTDILDSAIYAPTYEYALDLQKRFLAHPSETVERMIELFSLDCAFEV